MKIMSFLRMLSRIVSPFPNQDSEMLLCWISFRFSLLKYLMIVILTSLDVLLMLFSTMIDVALMNGPGKFDHHLLLDLFGEIHFRLYFL